MIIQKIEAPFEYEERNPDVQWKHLLFREQEINKLNELRDRVNEIAEALNIAMEKIHSLEKKGV